MAWIPHEERVRQILDKLSDDSLREGMPQEEYAELLGLLAEEAAEAENVVRDELGW